MKIAVVGAHSAALRSNRMEMMLEFVRGGHTVLAVGPDSGTESDTFPDLTDIRYHGVPLDRTGHNPLADILTFASLMRLFCSERPEKVFAFSAKPIAYASIAARICGIRDVYIMIAGLGSVLRGDTGYRNGVVRAILKWQYRIAARCSKVIFVQNPDDRAEVARLRIARGPRVVLVNGSGVNIHHYQPTPLPASPAVLFIGRLIRDKGIAEYLAACRELKCHNPTMRCLLVGPFDSNPSALTPRELDPFIDEGVIEYFGEQRDVRPFIAQCNVYVLPSYHEGTPKTVLEAMAMGRPIVTTDAPGCRETVADGVNGCLVPPGDVAGLVDAIGSLIANPDHLRVMGRQSRALVEAKYDVRLVNQSIMTAMGVCRTENGETRP
ncbi:MAG: glycosyltransferase family 1 protein [Actinobacteria bacterium]|nr:glycosyltransferase family 1 protein [Actinomycetota bacterium]